MTYSRVFDIGIGTQGWNVGSRDASPLAMQIQAVSGEIVAEFNEDEMGEMSGKLVKDLKKILAARIGLSRFRQRLFSGEELQDDMPMPSTGVAQLVLLNFAEPDQRMEEELLLQCKESRLEEVEMLLQRPQDPNGRALADITPIHNASSNGNLEVVQLLLEADADQNAVDSDGKIALHKAALKGHSEVVELLLQEGADKNAADWNCATALHLAGAQGHFDVVQLLLQAGAEINAGAEGLNGVTALHVAAAKGHFKVVQLLLQTGADKSVAAAGLNGATALHLAATRGHSEVVELLLQEGADKNAADANGLKPMHMAVAKGHLEVQQLLREACAGDAICLCENSLDGEITHVQTGPSCV